MNRMSTGVGLSFPEGSDTNDYVSRLLLSNNLSYNLCYFAQESVYLGKNSSSKIIYVKLKTIFPYVWHIKQ